MLIIPAWLCKLACHLATSSTAAAHHMCVPRARSTLIFDHNLDSLPKTNQLTSQPFWHSPSSLSSTAMARNTQSAMHRTPRPPQVRTCAALLPDERTRCGATLTHNSRIHHCSLHNKERKTHYHEYKRLSVRVEELKSQAALSERQRAQITTTAQADGAVLRLKEWRNGVMEEIRRRKSFAKRFCPRGAFSICCSVLSVPEYTVACGPGSSG